MSRQQGINRQQIKKLLNMDYMIGNYLGIFTKNKPKPIVPLKHQKIQQQKLELPLQPIQKIKTKKRPSSAKSRSCKDTGQNHFFNLLGHKMPVCTNRKMLIMKGNDTQINAQSTTLENTDLSNTIHPQTSHKKLDYKKLRTISSQKINKKHEKRLIRNRYEIVSVIGRGMSGQVYKAMDVLSKRLVAIKIIPIQSKQYHYMKEIQHKNIVEYYNSFIENEKRYLILQYFPMTLQTLLRKRRPCQDQVKKIFKQIVDAIVYLHGISIAHRDIKLDNIVVSQDLCTLKFIDFGLCIDTTQQFDNKQILSSQFCGTANYLAPEIVKHLKYDPRKADIWSLGVLLYVLCMGRHPFEGRDQADTFLKIQTKKIMIPTKIEPQKRKLIQNMLQKDPQKRPNILDILHNDWLKVK